MADNTVLPLTTAEQFVVRQLQAGREADLSGLPATDRVLKHEFVEKLITGGYPHPEIQRRGVSIINAIFKDVVEVSATEVPFRIWLKSCEFERGIDFSYTRFARDLSFEGSHFGKSSSESLSAPDDNVEAFFAGMKVGGTATFAHAKFDAPADFTYADFETDLVFDDVKSLAPADFDMVTVKGPAFFRRDYFADGLILADADLFELFMEAPSSILELSLSQARIQRHASLINVQLSSWKAGSLVAHGLVRLIGVTTRGEVDLSYSHFQNLEIGGFDDWLKIKQDMLNLEGFSFNTLDIPDAKIDPSAAKMLDLLDSTSCPFTPQPYLELERFLRAHGNVEKADEVYEHMRRRQRQKLSRAGFVWDLFLDWTLGYGKETWRVLLLMLAFTLAGTYAFRKDRMEWKNEKETPTKYSRLWFSLDEFAPVIDLGEAKNWRVKQDKERTRFYGRVHKVAGWILIPLVIASITGIVK